MASDPAGSEPVGDRLSASVPRSTAPAGPARPILPRTSLTAGLGHFLGPGFQVSSWRLTDGPLCYHPTLDLEEGFLADMQTTIQVVCTEGLSLRDSITRDEKLKDEYFIVTTRSRRGRNPGWAVLKSTLPDRQGTIRIEWIESPEMLFCRVVNRGTGRPDLIVGDFVSYLFKRHRKRLKLITILVDKSRARRPES